MVSALRVGPAGEGEPRAPQNLDPRPYTLHPTSNNPWGARAARTRRVFNVNTIWQHKSLYQRSAMTYTPPLHFFGFKLNTLPNESGGWCPK